MSGSHTSGNEEGEHKTDSDAVTGTDTIECVIVSSFHQLNTGLNGPDKTRHLQGKNGETCANQTHDQMDISRDTK